MHSAVASADALGIVSTCAALGLVVVAVAQDPAGTGVGVLTGFVQGRNTLYGITLYHALHERLLRNGSPAARSSDADAEPSRAPA